METVGDWEYNKKDLIGHGAFAVVFKGRNKKNHDDVVAVKCITKKNLSKSQSLLSKEIKILRELSLVQHENVVRLLDCKETPTQVYLVMEYCNGGDLAEFLQGKGTLSEDTIASFTKQLAGAMKALNAKGIVHRDLKPQNILLSRPENSNCHSDLKLKIADFGFARFLQSGVMAATLCGSPMYMAPEVIMSLQYDAKADLWSLGTMMYQCLTGKAPFQAQTPQQLKMFYERNMNLAPNVPAETSAELRDLLCKLLKRNARERIGFDEFFQHPFMNVKTKSKSSSPVPVPKRVRSQTVTSSAPSSGSVKAVSASPLSAKVRNSDATFGLRTLQPQVEREVDVKASPHEVHGFVKVNKDDAPKSSERRRSRSRSPEGFILVPNNLPADCSADRRPGANVDLREIFKDSATDVARLSAANKSSPTRCVQTAACRKLELGQQGAGLKSRKAESDLQDLVENVNRPNSLNVQRSSPRTEPVPVPTQIEAFEQLNRSLHERRNSSPSTPKGLPSAAKSAAVATKGAHSSPRDNRRRKCSGGSGSLPSIGSLSPPSVQFTIGTPPTPSWSKRHTTTNSTPPHSTSSPCRRGGPGPGSLPAITGSPTKVTTGFTYPPSMTNEEMLQQVESDAIAEVTGHDDLPDNARQEAAKSAVCEQALTGGTSPSSDLNSLEKAAIKSPSGLMGPISFVPPELSEETLLDKDHIDVLGKLNFVLALVECVIELAQRRSSPISESIINENTGKHGQFRLEQVAFVSEEQRRIEQIVLYIRALQLLSASLSLAKEKVNEEKLQASVSVKIVVKEMTNWYHHCLAICKNLHNQRPGNDAGLNEDKVTITADKLMYGYAIELCQTAALDEMFGHPEECFKRYRCAQILLHSLTQQVSSDKDRKLLVKYRESVERRLFHLHGQGLNISTSVVS